MRFPKGKYNGRPVTGIEIKLKTDLAWWCFVPKFGYKFNKSLHWLCFHVWIRWSYKFQTTIKEKG